MFSNMPRRASRIEKVTEHPKRDLGSVRVVIPPERGQGSWEVTRIAKDVYVTVANFGYKTPHVELMPGVGLIQFNINISGRLSMAVSCTELFCLSRPSLLVWNQPMGVDIRALIPPGEQERYVSISVRPEFLAEHLLLSGVAVPPALQTFMQPQRQDLSYYQRPLDAQTLELAFRLINNPHSGPLGLVYTEGLTLQLLCSVVATLSAPAGAAAEVYSERDLRALYAARDQLMQHLQVPPTIPQLVRSVGMGKSALTQGFKSLFGETVFEFSMRRRMRHALSLIRDQHWPISRAAEAVGYAHPTSFTTAFRRHFGIRPIDVRRVKPSGARVATTDAETESILSGRTPSILEQSRNSRA